MDGKILALCLLIAIGYVAGENYYQPDHAGDECDCPAYDQSECGPLPNLYAGGYALTQTPYGQTAKLICKEGFTPTENTTLHCGCDYQWSDSCAYCEADLSGTCFVVVFPQATRKSKNSVVRAIYVTTDRPAEVTIYSPYFNTSNTYIVTDCDEYHFSKIITLFQRNAINNKVVYVFSNESINVWARVARRHKSQIGMDQWQIRPCDSLSTTYWAVTNIVTNQLAIASLVTDSDTNCTIYDTTMTEWDQVLLPPESVWTYFSNGDYFEEDYTGFKIECDQNAAVFSSFYFANFPENEDGSRDAGIEQSPPYSEFALVCIAAPFRVGVFGIKLLSVTDDTKVYINKDDDDTYDMDFTLNKNENEIIEVDDAAVVIVSTNPTLSYSTGPTSSYINNILSDPCLLPCLDPRLWINDYYVPLPYTKYTTVTLRLTVATKDAEDLMIDGVLASTATYRTVKVPNGINYKVLYFYYDGNFPLHWNVRINSISGAMFGCDVFASQRVGQICYSCGRNYKAH